MRRHDEPVQVRLRTTDDAAGTPDAFLWRGRLYVVREVLATWLESEPWWEAARTPGHRVAPERTVWRVEAGAGRQLGVGVYDLAQAVAAPATAGAGAPGGDVRPGEQDQWWLLCQLD